MGAVTISTLLPVSTLLGGIGIALTRPDH